MKLEKLVRRMGAILLVFGVDFSRTGAAKAQTQKATASAAAAQSAEREGELQLRRRGRIRRSCDNF